MRRVLTILAVLTAVMSGPSAAQQDFDAFIASVNKAVPEYLKEFRVPGAALAIIRKGEISHIQGYGYADLERQKPVTPQTGFNIGSISKTVAAWGIMKLVEEGKLGLDAPVDTYLTRWHLPP
ncbi:MAG TPA: serine hydrolase domain-containing protein, partial [Bacteroidota bacterium]